MSDIVDFIQHPTLYGETTVSSRGKIQALSAAIISILVGAALIGILLVSFSFLGFYELQDLHDLSRRIDSREAWILLISQALIFGPVMGEIAFRGMFTRGRALPPFSFSLLAVIILSFGYRRFINTQFEVEGWIARLAAVIVMLALWLVLLFKRDQFNAWISLHRRSILIATVVGFSFMQLDSYHSYWQDPGDQGFLPGLLVLYAAVLAVGLSYVRVKCGIVWAIGLHIIHNAIFFSPLIWNGP